MYLFTLVHNSDSFVSKLVYLSKLMAGVIKLPDGVDGDLGVDVSVDLVDVHV